MSSNLTSSAVKYLGIDYGTKRVGIATSDDGGRMAFPLRVLANTPALVSAISEICRSEHIDTIVLGESHNYANQPNLLMEKILPFAEEIKKHTELPVVFMPEVLSSREAMHIQGDNAQNDASAAALVLQSYLDRTNPSPLEEFNEDEE